MKGSWVKSVFVMADIILDAFHKICTTIKDKTFFLFLTVFFIKQLIYCWLLLKRALFSPKMCTELPVFS